MNMSQQHSLVEVTANHIGGCISERVASTLKKIIIFLLSAQDLIITAVLRAGLPSTGEISAHWIETRERAPQWLCPGAPHVPGHRT